MAAGQSPDAFWHRTPREIHAVIQGVKARLRREHDDRAWLGYITAQLHRARIMPPLDKLLSTAKPPEPQTWQQQKSIARMMNKAFGGIEITRGQEHGAG